MRPILVRGFEPAPLFGIKNLSIGIGRWRFVAAGAEDQAAIDLEIRGEENAVLMFEEKLMDLPGILPAQFRNSRGQIGIHVWIAIKHLIDPLDFFGVVGKMDANERRFRVARDDAIERLQQLHARRINIRIAEPPTAMVVQLFPALIAAVVGQPECARISDVY